MSNSTVNSPSTSPDEPKKKSTAYKILVGFGWLTLVVIAVAAIYVGYLYKHLTSGGRQIMNDVIVHPTVAQQFPGEPSINLMIVGRDYDYNNQDQVIKSNARADLLMMAKLDFLNNEVKILSIPRDTKALIPGWPPSKINSAEQKGGPKLTEATVLANYDIPTDHYVALDFDGFQKAIDVLGGVDVTVDKKMDYDDDWGYLHIHLLPGYQHLNGNKAMGFVRFRHSDTDIIRTKRQQALLAALKIKLDQPHILVDLPELINIMNASAASDLTDKQKVALAYFLKGVPHSNIQMETIPTDAGSYYVYTDWPKADPILRSWFGADPPDGFSLDASPDSGLAIDAIRAGHRHRHAAAV